MRNKFVIIFQLEQVCFELFFFHELRIFGPGQEKNENIQKVGCCYTRAHNYFDVDFSLYSRSFVVLTTLISSRWYI